VYAQADTRLGGVDGKLLVSLARPSIASRYARWTCFQQKADQQLTPLRASIQDAVVRKRPRKEGAVRRAMHQLVCHDRLKRLSSRPRCMSTKEWSTTSSGSWDRRKKRQIKHRDLGKTVPLYGPPGAQRSPHGPWPTGIRPRWKTCSVSARVGGRAVVARASLDGQQTLGPCPTAL